MSKTYMRKEKGDNKEIICVPLSDWGKYRADGYVFVESADGKTPEQQFVGQGKTVAPAKKKTSKKKK